MWQRQINVPAADICLGADDLQLCTESEFLPGKGVFEEPAFLQLVFAFGQLTDVQQEINGLLTPDRKPKMDVARFRAINRNPLGYRLERPLEFID